MYKFILVVLLFTCTLAQNKNEECNFHGYLKSDGSCVCDSGYVTHEANNNTQCNYQQKNGMIAFWLTFFLTLPIPLPGLIPQFMESTLYPPLLLGIGYFYIGRTKIALGQLLCTTGSLFVYFIFKRLWDDRDWQSFVRYFKNTAILFGIVGWCVAWVMIIDNNVNDGNGVELNFN